MPVSDRSTPSRPAVIQEDAERPWPLSDGAEAFVFLGLLAFGFRNSLFDRFCPLAIQVSNSDRSGDPPTRSHKCALFCQCCLQPLLCILVPG